MESLNISIPSEMREFINERVRQTSHATPTEYIRSLVREDQKRAEQEQLEKLLLEGLRSGKPIVMDDVKAHFQAKRKALLARAKTKGPRS